MCMFSKICEFPVLGGGPKKENSFDFLAGYPKQCLHSEIDKRSLGKDRSTGSTTG